MITDDYGFVTVVRVHEDDFLGAIMDSRHVDYDTAKRFTDYVLMQAEQFQATYGDVYWEEWDSPSEDGPHDWLDAVVQWCQCNMEEVSMNGVRW